LVSTAFSNRAVIASYPPRSRRPWRNRLSVETQRGTTPIMHSDGSARAGGRRCHSSDTRAWRDPAGPQHRACVHLAHESSTYHGGVGSCVARNLDLPDACQDFIAELVESLDYARHPPVPDRGCARGVFRPLGSRGRVCGPSGGRHRRRFPSRTRDRGFLEHDRPVLVWRTGRGLVPPRPPRGTAPTPGASGDRSCGLSVGPRADDRIRVRFLHSRL
jgi:hypothetical protein